MNKHKTNMNKLYPNMLSKEPLHNKKLLKLPMKYVPKNWDAC